MTTSRLETESKKRETIQRPRKPLGQNHGAFESLTLDHENFHYHGVNCDDKKDPDRVQKFIDNGYEIVTEDEAGVYNARPGEALRRRGMLLMKQPIEFYNEDLKTGELKREADMKVRGQGSADEPTVLSLRRGV
jgi:hypothetical protein